MVDAPGTPPSVCANVAGPLEIWVGTGALLALEFLGWTVNGADIEESPFFSPIVSDEYGGDAGPPSDYQLMGTQHRISLEMSKYNETVAAKLNNFYNTVQAVTDSLTASVGMLINCNSLTTRLLLVGGPAGSPTFVRNYPAAMIIEPFGRAPIGAQATRARLGFISNAKAGVTPWNTTTS